MVPVIRNIWAVGRNYVAHIRELNNAIPEAPLIFLKAGSCTFFQKEISLPVWAKEVHHEVELALQFNAQLQIDHAGIALDLTEREEQSKAKVSGLPWTLAKSFTGACPISPLIPIGNIKDLEDLEISLHVNNQLKQHGRTSQMIFKIPDLVEYIKTHFPVCPGDLLLTGTPSGIGPIKAGDVLQAQISNLLEYSWQVSNNGI